MALVGFLIPFGAAAETPLCAPEAIACCRKPDNAAATPSAVAGFGVQVWPDQLVREPDSLASLVALRPAHLRFALGPNWRRQPALVAGMSDADLDAGVAAGFAGRPDTQASIELLSKLQLNHHVALHLVIWEPPPLPGEARAGAGAGRRLDPGNVPLMARFIVAVLRRLAELGLKPDAAEITNEPDGNWNIAIAPADYLALVRAVRQEAHRRAVSLPKLYGPGTSTIAALRQFLRPGALARDLVGAVDVLSTHGWDDPARQDRFAALQAVRRDLAGANLHPQIAITEFALARPVPADTSDRMNVKKRVPGGVSGTPFYATASARDLLRFFGSGIGTVIYWEFQDQTWGRASFGLRDAGGRPRPIYDSMSAIAREIAARRTRLVAGQDPRTTFVDDGSNNQVWLANPSATPLDVVPDGPGEIVPAPGDRAGACRTSSGRVGLRLAPWTLIRAIRVTP